MINFTSRTWSLACVLVLSSAPACSSATATPAAPTCKADPDCAASPGKPLCDVTSSACVALPPGHEIGYRDGASTSVTFTEIYAMSAAVKPTDLGFHPERKDELWVVGYGDDSVHVGAGIGSDAASWKRLIDPAAKHFMHKPPALAMGAANSWGTCGDNDNSQNAPDSDGKASLFMGPALLSLDLAIFAKPTAGRLGSHIDMLHESPMCRGIAHVRANLYWVFNSFDKSLDKVNFNKPHEPGGDDHSDGDVYRYAAGQVKGADDGTPSHIFFDAADGFLYVADTGNQRIVRLDTTSGKEGGELPRILEPLRADAMMDGTTLEVVVAAGTLAKPSGLEVHNDLLYVTDAATSTFHVYDKTGKELRSLATDLPAGSLAGFTFGPEGKIYFTDKVAGRVVRIDAQ